MKYVERLFCGGLWIAWVVTFVGQDWTRPEDRPRGQGSSGEACRSLLPDRTILPGW